ncbi:hypothetical protein BH10PLA1_BH10PLA1_02910 [soil metagenome]
MDRRRTGSHGLLLPLVFIILATLASAVMAYGTHPSWAQYSHGLDLILWTRRLQWPLITFAMVMCIALLVLIISGKRRAWWLIGLAPVLALFAHKFHVKPGTELNIAESPAMVSADAATFLQDGTYVVGLTMDDEAYAFPYPVLFNTPGVIVQNREKKLMLIWSAYANRAVASTVELDLHARDLEVVSTPANSVLIYNSRLGQFIVGVTGRTDRGDVPSGFHAPVQVTKTTWSHWRSAHPQSQVMLPLAVASPPIFAPPTGPILPQFAMPNVSTGVDPKTRVAVIQSVLPAAVVADALTDAPANLSFGDEPVLLLRDGPGGPIRAYDRRIDGDLFVRLKPYHNTKKPLVLFADDSSNSLWSRGIVAIEGGPEVKGKKLMRIPVEEDLYWGVMKYWYKDLQLYRPVPD